jgi:ATP-dependent Clp protease protease subunit
MNRKVLMSIASIDASNIRSGVLQEPIDKPYFQFNKVNDQKTEISIYGDIASWRWFENDVSSHSFKSELDAVETPEIEVHINSYGGEVAEGLAIYNMLKSSDKEVTTINDGFACSIASVIFMAGKNRVMNTGSLLMWHNPWVHTAGNANELEKAAADLRKMAESSVEIYSQSSKLTSEEIKELMDKETWITADEAIEWGVATSKAEQKAKQTIEAKTLHSTIHRLKQLERENEELRTTAATEPIAKSEWDLYYGGK